jgi:hypothetical protein
MSRFNTVKQSKGNLLHLPDKKFEVLPGAWVSIDISLHTYVGGLKLGNKEMFALRMFHEQGVYDHPFYIVITRDY